MSELKKCFVKTDTDGHQYVYMPNGKRIPAQVRSVVIDDEKPNNAKALLSIFVELK